MLRLQLLLPLLDDRLSDVDVQRRRVPEETRRTGQNRVLGQDRVRIGSGGPTSGSGAGPRWASWGTERRPAPSGSAWTGRSARTSAGSAAETRAVMSR